MAQSSLEMVRGIVEFLVKGLVEHSDKVRVEVHDSEDSAVVAISVEEAEKGRLIGRDGKTINAIRTLVGALPYTDKRVSVEIVQK